MALAGRPFRGSDDAGGDFWRQCASALSRRLFGTAAGLTDGIEIDSPLCPAKSVQAVPAPRDLHPNLRITEALIDWTCARIGE